MVNTAQLDVQVLLTEIDPAQPCGDNLEYDPAFLALEEAIQGKAEVQYGDTIVAAIAPDWKAIHALCTDLFLRTRDLRIAVSMTRSSMHFYAIPGLAFGLSLIEELIKQRWEPVYPQLDPNDDLDPMMRVNALSSLIVARGLLRELSDSPLVDTRMHGQASLRDIDLVTGEIEGDPNSRKRLQTLEAAFLEVDIGVLQQTLTELDVALARTHQIESALTDKVGPSRSISLMPLSKMLKRAADFVRERVVRRLESAAADGAGDDGETVATVTGMAGKGQKTNGDIASRADVVRMLEKICKFYATHEPSSPIPLLLQRAQRLVDKNFVEILRDFAPDGLNQACQIGGIDLN